MRGQLKAALGKYAPERLADLPEETWERQTAIEPPTEKELQAYEEQVEVLAPPLRALLLLPLDLGLRSAELLALTRESVERALEGGDLLVFRKGGRERLLACDNARALLADLLSAKDWALAWQLLSPGGERAAYRKLHRLVQSLGGEGVHLRPHKLRHGFATRMMRAGASLPQIQFMMDHTRPETTGRYVHPEKLDVMKFLTKRGGK